MCAHKLFDGPLCCTRTDDHRPGHGCTYAASAGADLGGEEGAT